MTDYIIIRAGVNGGKTTTCGLLFENLIRNTQNYWIFDTNLESINELKYSEEGNLYDFVAILIINEIVIIIISQGDIASDLAEIMDKLENIEFVSNLIGKTINSVNYMVVCARSQMRQNSTIEMLYKRILGENRAEFWTLKSESPNEKFNVKASVVNEIAKFISKK